jgi:PPK2 family polyphosphate:nucleotide phosphotransferase
MSSIKLKKISTKAPPKFDKENTVLKTTQLLLELDDLQNLLFAERKHALLIILQGMDASGKDGTVRNVFGKLNPEGVTVKSFKTPTAEELSRDFLWRVHANAPAKGMIQIFNRSHYEDILITRVHKWCDDKTAQKRMEAINDFEKLLTQHGNTQILKFYLHISPEEQQQRLQERMRNPKKMWKYNENDFAEAKLWDTYTKMYEDCFEVCNTIPWHIIPSDQNWYKEHLITTHVYNLLKGLNMKYPTLNNSK